MPPPSTTLRSLRQTPRTPGDLGASRRRALKGGGMEGGFPFPILPPPLLLFLPISWRPFSTLRDHFPSRAIFSIGDNSSHPIACGRMAPHGIARLGNCGERLGTVYGH